MDLAAHQASPSSNSLTWITRPLQATHLPAQPHVKSRTYTARREGGRDSIATVHRSKSGPNTPTMVEPRITIPLRPVSSRHASISSTSKSPRHGSNPSEGLPGAYVEPSSDAVRLQGSAEEVFRRSAPIKRTLSSSPTVDTGDRPRKSPTKRKKKTARARLPSSDSGPITMTEPEEGRWVGGVWVKSQSKTKEPHLLPEEVSDRQQASEEAPRTDSLPHQSTYGRYLAESNRMAEMPPHNHAKQDPWIASDPSREDRAGREALQRSNGRPAYHTYSNPPPNMRISTSSLTFAGTDINGPAGSTSKHLLGPAYNRESINDHPALRLCGEPRREIAYRFRSRDDVNPQAAETAFARLQDLPVYLDHADGYPVTTCGTPPEPPAAQPSRSQRGVHGVSDPHDDASLYKPWPEEIDPSRIHASHVASHRGAQDGWNDFVDRSWIPTYPTGFLGEQAAAESMHDVSQTNGPGWASDPVEMHTSKYPMSMDTPSPSPSLPEMSGIVSNSPPQQPSTTRPPMFLERQTTYSRRRPRQYILARLARRELDSPLDDGVTYSYGYDRKKRERSTSVWPISDGGRNEILVPASSTGQIWRENDQDPPPMGEADGYDGQVLQDDALFSAEAYERRRQGHQLRQGERNGPFVDRFEMARQARERDLGDRFHLFDPASQDEERNEQWAGEREREGLKPLCERFDVSAYATDGFPEPYPAPELRGRKHRLVMGRRNDGGIGRKRRWRYGSPSWGEIQREPGVYRLNMTGTSGTREHIEEYMHRLKRHSPRFVHPPLAAFRSQLKRRRSTALVQAESIPQGTLRDIPTIPFTQAAPLLRQREEEAKARMAVNSGLIRAVEKSMRQANLGRVSRGKKASVGGRGLGARHDLDIHSPPNRTEIASGSAATNDAVENSALPTCPTPIITRARKSRIPQLPFTSRNPEHLRVTPRGGPERGGTRTSRAGDAARETPGSISVSARGSGEYHHMLFIEDSHTSGRTVEKSINSSSEQNPQERRGDYRSALSFRDGGNDDSVEDSETAGDETELSQARTMTDANFAGRMEDHDGDNLRVGPNYVRERAERVRKEIEERARIEREEYLARLVRGASNSGVVVVSTPRESQNRPGRASNIRGGKSASAAEIFPQTQQSQNAGGVPSSGNTRNQEIDAEFEEMEQRVPSVQAPATSLRPGTRSQTRSASQAALGQQTRESSLDRDLGDITVSQAEVFVQEYLSDDRSDHLIPDGDGGVAQPDEESGAIVADSEHTPVQINSPQHMGEEPPSKAIGSASTANQPLADKRLPLRPLSLTGSRVTGHAMLEEGESIASKRPQNLDTTTAASKMSGVQMTNFLADLLQKIPLTRATEANSRRQSRRRVQDVQSSRGQGMTGCQEDRPSRWPMPLTDTDNRSNTEAGVETGTRPPPAIPVSERAGLATDGANPVSPVGSTLMTTRNERVEGQDSGDRRVEVNSQPERTPTGTDRCASSNQCIGQVFKTPGQGSRRPSRLPLAVKRDITPPYIVLSDPQAEHLEPWYAQHRRHTSTEKTTPALVSSRQPGELQGSGVDGLPSAVGVENSQRQARPSYRDKKTGMVQEGEQSQAGVTDGSFFSRYIVDQGAPFELTPPSYDKATSYGGGTAARRGSRRGGMVGADPEEY